MTRADGRIQGDFNSEGGSRTSVATNSEKGITAIGWPPLFLPAKEEEKPPRWRGTNLPVGPHLRSSNDGFHGSCSPVKDSGCITYLQTPMMKTFRTVIKGAAKQLGDEVSKQQPILAGQRGPQLGRVYSGGTMRWQPPTSDEAIMDLQNFKPQCFYVCF